MAFGIDPILSDFCVIVAVDEVVPFPNKKLPDSGNVGKSRFKEKANAFTTLLSR